MDETKRKWIHSWLKKASHDLGTARILIYAPEQYLDTAIYHCQQAAEKALKAYLSYHEIAFEKTHNLSALVDLCVDVNPEFQKYYDAADTLTPYATAFRYPGEFFEDEPDVEEVEEAFRLAKEIYDFVCQQLPPEVRNK
ncbi:MAG: HEPN domain-containing protein [Methanobacteriota archaeon]|nr:MAG: HEPN domain-containing protein [Euryarchaeota archaeon]